MTLNSLLVAATVTAYCLTSKTATGTKPRPGVVAGPKHLLGRNVQIAGKRYRVEDIHPRGRWDIWLPSRHACREFGRKNLTVKVFGKGKR